MEEHPPHYHSPHPSAPDMMQLLANKVFHNLSIPSWSSSRMIDVVPIYRNEIAALRHEILQPFSARQLLSEHGAYANFEELFDSIVSTYTQYNTLAPPTSPLPIWQWKLSWDNRYIAGKNEAWTLTPTSINHFQQPMHTHLLMLAHIPERNIPMRRCVAESGLNEFVGELDGSELTWQDTDITQQVISSTDWISACRELAAPLPNTPNLFAPVCWKCGVNKQWLRHDYVHDPFHWHDPIYTISDFPDAVLSNLPLSSRRYCLMHGVANLLSNILTNLYNLLPPGSFQAKALYKVVHTISSHWKPSSNPLIPKEMKRFFASDCISRIVSIFKPLDTKRIFRWNSSPYQFTLTTSQAVCMLLESTQTFYHFAYKEVPTFTDFQNLLVARDCILSCHASWGWWMAPTTHYLTTHTITEAEADKTAYITLQEGVEHENRVDKGIFRVTFASNTPTKTSESCWQYIVNQHQLRLLLLQSGYSTPTNYLTSYSTPISSKTHVVARPKYAPN